MHLKTLALFLALAPTAHAAVMYKLPTVIGNIAPVTMPGTALIPLSLPTVNAVIASPTLKPALNPTAFPISSPVSLPVLPAAAIGRVSLPGVPSPLPLPTPAALSAARRPAPSVVERFVLDWSRLDDKDGDDLSPALVPNDPGPQPLSPAGALNELRDATHGREPIRTAAGKVFDGRRETIREVALPHAKFF